MDTLMTKTGTLLNGAADVFDQVVLAASQFESTLSPAAMSVVRGCTFLYSSAHQNTHMQLLL